MKINTTKLRTALASLHKITKSGNSLPILSCVRVEAKNNTLTLSASSLDEWQTEEVECGGELAPCCISLAQFTSAIGGESVNLALTKDVLSTEWGEGNAIDVKTLSAEEFPTAPTPLMKKAGVACADLSTAILAVAGFTDRNAKRYTLEAVNIVANAKLIRCQAATGKELAAYELPAIASQFECLVPDSSIKNLTAALMRSGAVFSECLTQVSVQFDGGSYGCKQIDATFPNTDPILKAQFNSIGVCSPKELMEAFSRCNCYLEPARVPLSRLRFSKAFVEVGFCGQNSNIQLTVAGKFEPFTCTPSVESMKKSLAALDGDEVKIGATDTTISLSAGNLTIINQLCTGEFQGKSKRAA